MNRAHEQPSFIPVSIPVSTGSQQVFVRPEPARHASPRPTARAGAGIPGNSVGNRPGITSTRTRTGPIFLPPPPLPPLSGSSTTGPRMPALNFTCPQYGCLPQPAYHAMVSLYPNPMVTAAPIDRPAYRPCTKSPNMLAWRSSLQWNGRTEGALFKCWPI